MKDTCVMTQVVTTVAVVAAATLAAGCDTGDAPEGAAADDTVAARPAPDAAAGEVPGTAADGAAVEARLTEWDIDLERDTVPAGTTTFRVANDGEYAHAFEVERGDDEWETDVLEPGQEATLVAPLEPGEYEVYCPVEDEHGQHEELGMRTVLIVR